MKKHTLIFIVAISMKIENLYAMESPLKYSYASIFTDDIYDQKTISQQSPKYQEEAIEKLYELKERSLSKVLALRLKPKLSIYEEYLKQAVDQSKTDAIIGIFKEITKIATAPLQCISVLGVCLKSLSKVLDHISVVDCLTGLDNVVSGISGVVDNGVLLKRGGKNLVSQVPNIYKEILELKLEMEGYQEGIRAEKIKSEEEYYVTHKKDIPEDLQKSIQEALIKSRLPDQAYYSPLNFLKDALSLPLTHKNLEDVESWGKVTQRFNENNFFKVFSEEVRQEVQGIIKNMYFASLSTKGKGPKSGLKNVYYIWGNPGMGKSKTAKEIAKFFNLPAYEQSLGGKSVLNVSELQGTTWLHQGKPGWIARAFLKKGDEGKIYKNSVLIINDLHTLFMGGNNQQDIKFLLQFLDDETEDYENSYFNSPLDLRHLIIILTSNEDVPQDKIYAPLRDRLKDRIIHFPDFKKKRIKPILMQECKKYMKHFRILPSKEINAEILAEQVLEESETMSMRALKKSLHKKVESLPSHPDGKASYLCKLGEAYYFGNGVAENNQKARKLFEKTNEMGYKDAQMFTILGSIYSFGDGVEQNYEMANDYLQRAIDMGNDMSCIILGDNFYHGNGVQKNLKKAQELFEKGVDRGYEASSVFNILGRLYDDYGEKESKKSSLRWWFVRDERPKKDYKKANAYYKKAISEGSIEALFNLGLNYYRGLGKDRNDKKAQKYLEKAEEMGCMEGLMFHTLGEIYRDGLGGVQQDHVKANEYFQKGIEQGFIASIRDLGFNHYNGNGVAKNTQKAREYFEEAEEKGHKDGLMFDTLGLIYDAENKLDKANSYYQKGVNECYVDSFIRLGRNYLMGNGVTSNMIKARELFEQAATKGYKEPTLLNWLGEVYQNGLGGVKQDYNKANAYFQAASDMGHACSSRNLGFNYLRGNGVPKNLKKAQELFEEAERRGYRDGEMFYHLGFLYNYGFFGAQKDYAKAIAYYGKSIEMKYAQASSSLGFCYYHGDGVPKDINKARELFEQALSRGYEHNRAVFERLGEIYKQGLGGVAKNSQKANYYFKKAKVIKKY
ncbi:MAG: hypothetical protein BGO67_10625 [Alphaproteobacteria bacterium 41-28]|nr:MAG: hypothetical protein BGO67_10625 [Alphaproteobacteria bacterium 41-28]